ncbi:MAG: serine/threonine-protein kinase, partial [Verrucomicrobiota bacterium]
MEERYEIREKIGQGGMGSVYRAYDTRMNREVAIKRIQQEGEEALEQATSQQIIREAGALAQLQHPHIVTVYDVGTDEQGPYVVMELISGKTLDELIERAPLTWADFHELALQTQEALIAAQELNLVHRDLKPGNLMLTWLPSGRFQVKIVDFGLANLAEASQLDQLENTEAVYGSIFFMCPEHFERVKLDMRSDMYSLGCVYYNALTGNYPFTGDTGLQVMTAHLHHQVIPLQEVRPDIPLWACNWVMWHLNRLSADRPQNARESLKIFLQNSKVRSSSMQTKPNPPTTGQIQPPRSIGLSASAQGPAPAIIVPEPPRTQTAPQALLPPEGSKPSVHASPPP